MMYLYIIIVLGFTLLNISSTEGNYNRRWSYGTSRGRNPPYWYCQESSCPNRRPTVLSLDEIRRARAHRYTAIPNEVNRGRDQSTGPRGHSHGTGPRDNARVSQQYTSPYLTVINEPYGKNDIYRDRCKNVACSRDDKYVCVAPMGNARCVLKQSIMNPTQGSITRTTNSRNMPAISLMDMKPMEWQFSHNETKALRSKPESAGAPTTRRPANSRRVNRGY